MRGSPVYQVQLVFEVVNEIGTSKHDAKAVARSRGAKSWHQIGKGLGIHSYKTGDDYRAVWRRCLKFAKQTAGLRDIEQLTGDIVRSFLEAQVDHGVVHATFGQYAAALEKLEVALNRYAKLHGTGREYAFSSEIQCARDIAVNLERFEGSRAYTDSDRLVAAIDNEVYSLSASIQRESGCRIAEANHIRRVQLQGIQLDRHTGEQKGWVGVAGKGGKVRAIGVTPKTYAQLEAIFDSGQHRFEFNKNCYRESLKAAAELTDQEYEGSHGLRWSWAQERHAALQELGMTYEKSLSVTSQEMGHERGDITIHYLR